MKVLIAGGAGLVGSHLAHRLVANGHTVGILDAFGGDVSLDADLVHRVRRYRSALISGAQLIQADVCDLGTLTQFVKPFGPTHIVNLANVSLALGAERRVVQSMDMATTAVRNLLIVAGLCGSRRVLHFSSSYTYGHFVADPVVETHALNPINVYGRTKVISEIACATLSEAMSVPATVVRPISIYGPADLYGKFSAANLRKWLATGQLALHGGPARLNTLTHVADVANAVELLLTREDAAGQTYNLSSDEHLTNLQIRDIFREAGFTLDLASPDDGTLKVPVRGRASIEKLKALGYAPSGAFRQELGRLIEFATSAS